MKKIDNTKVQQMWQKIGALADGQILKPENAEPQIPEPPKEISAKKPRKGKVKK